MFHFPNRATYCGCSKRLILLSNMQYAPHFRKSATWLQHVCTGTHFARCSAVPARNMSCWTGASVHRFDVPPPLLFHSGAYQDREDISRGRREGLLLTFPCVFLLDFLQLQLPHSVPSEHCPQDLPFNYTEETVLSRFNKKLGTTSSQTLILCGLRQVT